MSKQQMIDQIRTHNRTVSDEFLAHFDERALQQYLDRLTHVLGRRGRASVWVRDASSAAVVSREHSRHDTQRTAQAA